MASNTTFPSSTPKCFPPCKISSKLDFRLLSYELLGKENLTFASPFQCSRVIATSFPTGAQYTLCGKNWNTLKSLKLAASIYQAGQNIENMERNFSIWQMRSRLCTNLELWVLKAGHSIFLSKIMILEGYDINLCWRLSFWSAVFGQGMPFCTVPFLWPK